MGEFVNGVFSAPVATLFIVSGIVFLFIAVVGNISGKLEPSAKSRILSGILGLVFVIIGLIIHFTQDDSSMERSKPVSSQQPQTVLKQVPKQQKASNKQNSVLSNADSEPNNQITQASVINVGSTVRGSIQKDDRDYYQFSATSGKTRVILRKISLKGFSVVMDVYDEVESLIISGTQHYDKPVTLAFESNPGSVYYLLVKPYSFKYSGNYELVVREEK